MEQEVGNTGRINETITNGDNTASTNINNQHDNPSNKEKSKSFFRLINPFLLKSRGMKYCPSGKTPTY